MSELQWALLIFGTIAVVAIYVYSRRDSARLKNWDAPGAGDTPIKPRPSTREQMDMFRQNGEFDEYGVGRPRIAGRREPTMDDVRSRQPGIPEASTATATPATAKPSVKVDEKVFTLLIAEREGTSIYGAKLHDALKAQKLQFGARQIYHRLEQGMVQYSVASLVKPGTLDPADAAGFSTPGLSMFLMLPGPVKPLAAFDDMLATAKGLAASLNGVVFDAKRQPLSAEAEATLRAEVEAWAKKNHLV